MPLTPLHQPWSTSLHTVLHFYSKGTVFPDTNTVPIYIFPPKDNIINAMILARKMCALCCKYTAIWRWHLQVHATCFHAHTIHFPRYHTFGQKYIFAVTYGMTHVKQLLSQPRNSLLLWNLAVHNRVRSSLLLVTVLNRMNAFHILTLSLYLRSMYIIS